MSVRTVCHSLGLHARLIGIAIADYIVIVGIRFLLFALSHYTDSDADRHHHENRHQQTIHL